MSSMEDLRISGLQEAFELFQRSEETQLFLCINSYRIPVDPRIFPEKYTHSTMGTAEHSGFYSVGTLTPDTLKATNIFSAQVLADILDSGSSTATSWKKKLCEVPLFSTTRRCEGIVDPGHALARIFMDVPTLAEMLPDPEEILAGDPYLGIYAPSPSSRDVGTVESPRMPSFDVHFPVVIPKGMTIDLFAKLWKEVRRRFAQKTVVGFVECVDDSSVSQHAVFFGPPENSTSANDCIYGCSTFESLCEAEGRYTESPPEFSSSLMKKWKLTPSSGDFNYSALWKSIATLSEPHSDSESCEPSVLDPYGNVPKPLSLQEFWQRKWNRDRVNGNTSPTGCTFAKPSAGNALGQAELDLFICGDSSDFFRLLFQPIVCRQEQLLYLSHQRLPSQITIKVDVPPQIGQPSKRAVPLSFAGWEKFRVPASLPGNIHPASRMTPVEWDGLFSNSTTGVVQ